MDIFIAVISTVAAVAPIAMGAGAYLHYRFGKTVKAVVDQLKAVKIS
jgi:hypothetical protein